MPNGKIQTENIDTLKQLGNWMKLYAATIQGTRGNIIPTQEWGVVTAKEKSIFVHILKQVRADYIFVPYTVGKVKWANLFSTKTNISFKQVDEGVFLYLKNIKQDQVNTIVQLELN
jgi:alpha-L-fucosidase